MTRTLYREDGRVKSFLRPVAEQKIYDCYDVANSVYRNILKNYPDLKVEIIKTGDGFVVRLKE